MQRPHPPCYIVGTGSPETIDIAAEYGFGYASVFVTQERARELNQNLRKRAKDFGHTIRPEQLPILTFVYVAETEEQARAEYVPHLKAFFEDREAFDRAAGTHRERPAFASGEAPVEDWDRSWRRRHNPGEGHPGLVGVPPRGDPGPGRPLSTLEIQIGCRPGPPGGPGPRSPVPTAPARRRS